MKVSKRIHTEIIQSKYSQITHPPPPPKLGVPPDCLACPPKALMRRSEEDEQVKDKRKLVPRQLLEFFLT